MWKKIIIFSIIFQLFLVPAYCIDAKTDKGADKSISTDEKPSDYSPLRKIARGGINTLFCWVEIPRQAMKINREKGDVAAIFWGPLKGLTYTAGRFCVGIYEIATFLIPPYKPVVKPEFIFSEEEQED